MSAVSVVVPSYQRRESVLRVLRALSEQTAPAESYEVVVSVDGSTDGTAEAARALPTPFRLTVHWQPNRGRAAACNAGVRRARGDVVVLLDDDMEPAPTFLAAHRRAHAAGGRLGVMGAVPVRVGPTASGAARFVGATFNGHLENLARPGYRPLLTDFYSGNFSVPRAVLLEVGGFDEAFREYGNEDLELSIRLRRAGCRLVYAPDALAYQHYEKGFGALAADRRAAGRTAVLLALKHPEAAGHLRLGAFSEGPPPLRALRAGLLAVERAWPAFPGALARGEAALGRAPLPGRRALYSLALGYFYWLGVRDALSEAGEAAHAVPTLRALAKALHA